MRDNPDSYRKENSKWRLWWGWRKKIIWFGSILWHINHYSCLFNWNNFEMRLLDLRINFFIYCGLFVLILVVFVLFLLSLRFGQISTLAFFRWFSATSDRNAESCNRIPIDYCVRQQLWKAAITGDTVTRLSIPMRGRGKSPEEGQRWNLAET